MRIEKIVLKLYAEKRKLLISKGDALPVINSRGPLVMGKSAFVSHAQVGRFFGKMARAKIALNTRR